MQDDKTLLVLENLNVNELLGTENWKEKQEKIVAENPYIEVIDNKTYDAACKSRTALLKGRTSLESQDKLLASKLTSFRKLISEESKSLIAITQPHEEKQQIEVKRYELIKENEKLEKQRLENERIAGIKAKIDEIESDSYALIQSMDYGSILPTNAKLSDFIHGDYDFEEYDVLFEQVASRIQKSVQEKVDNLTEKENNRIEKERLESEAAAAVKLAKDLQDKIEADNLAREKKAKEQEESLFAVRCKRLNDLGFVYNKESNQFIYKNDYFEHIVNGTEVLFFSLDIFEFFIEDKQKLIVNAKKEFEDAEVKKAVEQKEKIKEEKRILTENKERVLRLAGDKKLLTKFISSLVFSMVIPDMETDECHESLKDILVRVQTIKKDLNEIVNNI